MFLTDMITVALQTANNAFNEPQYHHVSVCVELVTKQVCYAALIVFFAMGVDLGAGLYKAKLRGEMHSSWGLKRSVSKFILYEGALLIAGGMDILFSGCRIMQTVGLPGLDDVAMITFLLAILLLMVELWSLREKAEEKTKKDINRAGELMASVLSKDKLTEAFNNALTEAINKASANSGKEATDGEV